MVLSMDGTSPWWNSTGPELQQSTLSGNLSLKIETPVGGFQKQLGFHFQEQDSSSTQSTGQSYAETVTVAIKNFDKNALSIQSGFSGLSANPDEDQSKSTVSFQDCVFPYQPIDYRQSACLLHADPYNHGSVTAYAPYPGVQSLIMGMTPTRVPLPINPLQNEPIYVNAKQYKAILRRRESRAKLDAQNKIPKARKPYLHESRHRHALKRARGTGGRFLNKEKLQDSKASMESDGSEISGSLQLKLNVKEGREADLYQQENSMVNRSDITKAYNHFHPEELRFSVYQPQSGGNIPAGGCKPSGAIQQFISVIP